LRVFFFILIAQLSLCLPVFAAEKTPQTLDEINADLNAKKAALEPFDDKKVKVDLESLGLDAVDDKKVDDKKIPEALEDKKPSENKVDKKPTTPTVPLKSTVPAESKAADAPKSDAGILTKIQNLLHTKPAEEEKKPETKAATTTPETTNVKKTKPTNSTEKYVNSEKKQSLKKRLQQERPGTHNESKQKDKLKKLNELRKQYLIKIKKDDDSSDDMFEESEKIIPQKKQINRFLEDEAPPPPLAAQYRTRENLHIPLPRTPQQNVEIVFNSIGFGNINIFNNAYDNIRNPNIQNSSGDTILTYSILLQRYAFIASALNKGADPNMPNRLGYTPLSIAIEMRDIKAFSLLVENDAKTNYVDLFGRNYLMHAARVGFLTAVATLVDKGVDMNALDNDGFTALSIAYRHKQELVVQYLIKHGAKTWVEKPYVPDNQILIRELESRWKN